MYYVPPGAPICVSDEITTPNGLQLGHDEKTLDVNDTGGLDITFNVQPDGRLANHRAFESYVGCGQTLPRALRRGRMAMA